MAKKHIYLILDEVIPESAFPSYTGMGCVVTAGEGADNKRVYNFFIHMCSKTGTCK